jgi:hypothetical protein
MYMIWTLILTEEISVLHDWTHLIFKKKNKKEKEIKSRFIGGRLGITSYLYLIAFPY